MHAGPPRHLLPLLSVLVGACGAPRVAEDPSAWFDPGADFTVSESVAFTDQPYSFTGLTPIADLPAPEPFQVLWEDGGALPACPDWERSSDLPAEITGIVTVLPRYYYKTDGCDGDEEKYYGSFFVQDASGGVFVLGDSKVNHFDAGDRVTLSIRGITNRFDLTMVTAHDVVEVQRGPEPIYYVEATGPFDLPDIAQVRRVTGTVTSDPDTFGAFTVTGDDGTAWAIALDSDLNRRGVHYDVGSRVQVTGPIIYSYSAFSIVVLQKGQVDVLTPATGD